MVQAKDNKKKTDKERRRESAAGQIGLKTAMPQNTGQGNEQKQN